MNKELITALCLWGLIILAGAGAILGKVFNVPELVSAAIGLFGAGLGYYLRGTAGGIRALLATAALGASLGIGGCVAGSQSLPATCAIKAASAAVQTFASCCAAGGKTMTCQDGETGPGMDPLTN